MNFLPRWGEMLSNAGLEAIHWSNVGAATATGEIIMAFAHTGPWSVLTNDVDFGLLLAASLDDGPSVVQLRARHTNSDAHGEAVVRSIRWAAPQLEPGALLTVDPGRMRVRLLPLHPPLISG